MQKFSENTDSVKPILRRGLGRLPSWLKSKYLIAGVFFVIWMLFFDKNDVFSQLERSRHSNELTKNETRQSQQIIETGTERYLLKTSQGIEKYAREKYMMKKDNEDLFILKNPSENK